MLALLPRYFVSIPVSTIANAEEDTYSLSQSIPSTNDPNISISKPRSKWIFYEHVLSEDDADIPSPMAVQSRKVVKPAGAQLTSTANWQFYVAYFLLAFVRLHFALSNSYIHPDEHFQGPEVVVGM